MSRLGLKKTSQYEHKVANTFASSLHCTQYLPTHKQNFIVELLCYKGFSVYQLTYIFNIKLL